MARHVAFLRAINVGGHVVTMDSLRKAFERMGFDDVETFIASGNVIFTSAARARGALEHRIEAALEKALGYEVKTFLRSPEEVAAIAAYAPFSAARIKSAAALNVGLLAAPLPAAGRAALAALETDIDAFHVNGSEIYWLCTSRQSESKFSNAVFERAVKTRATFRGINTMVRLSTRLNGAPSR